MSDPGAEVTGGRGEMYVVDSPHEVARWRPLAQWVLAIPHLFVAGGVGALTRAVAVIYWFKHLFTKKLDPELYKALAMGERYELRTSGYLLGFSEQFPPFDFPLAVDDNGAYPPVALNLPELPESSHRGAAWNILKAIPHYFVVAFFAIGAVFVLLAAWFAVLFTGRWPEGMRRYLVRLTNYYLRVWVYVLMVDNTYPKFGLSPA